MDDRDGHVVCQEWTWGDRGQTTGCQLTLADQWDGHHLCQEWTLSCGGQMTGCQLTEAFTSHTQAIYNNESRKITFI